MANEKSCVGCKFLYSEGLYYSNYTWEETEIRCAKEKNPNLPVKEGYDWNLKEDNCSATNQSRCELYSPGPMVELDVDEENGPADFTQDEEAIVAICLHSNRGRHHGLWD